MTSPRSPRGARRDFLKQLPTVIAAGLAAPNVARAQAPPVVDAITADTLATAQQISGVSLPAAERESARSLVARNRDHIDSLRRVPLPSETEPAFSFRPPRPVASPAKAVKQPARANRVKRPAGTGDLAFAPVTMLAALLKSRQITSTELTQMYLSRLKKHDTTLFCVVTLTEDLALAQAEAADKEIRAGKYRGPLHGVPYGIKDLFSAKGVLTTWGAKPYSTQIFDYDATVVTRLREAGAVLAAKLSTGELAVGDLWFRARTRNPWNPERGSSGSSAGPAAATAAGLVGFAIGTETGGSIISPSATCGVVGLRPTYGRISRHGCMTLRWTLDKVGPITRSAADAALVLAAIHGPDGHDDTVPDVPFTWDGSRDIKGMRLGYVEREFAGPPESASAEDRAQWAARKPLFDAALDVYRKAGATLVPIALPDLPAASIYAILNAEAGAMFDELVRTGAINDLADKGPNGRANQLRASRFIPAVEYIRAQRVRTLLLQRMNALLETVDAFVAPSSSDSVTICNLTGHPAIVVPAGLADGLPIGLMVTAPLWKEDRLMQAATAYEAQTAFHAQRPARYSE
jgi:Asp-tRNA(Asn)/Glu-tRNA(Gln) amidotransferase A subunit family amidase